MSYQSSFPYSNTPYGTQPSQVALPPSQYQQAADIVPVLPQLTSNTASRILDMLSGRISPSTNNAILDSAAARGISSGAGSGFAGNDYLQNLGLTSENQIQKGVGDYLSFLTGVGNQQLNPETELSTATGNAQNAAAPNPALAAQQQLSMFQQYLNSQSNPSGASNYGSQAWASNKGGGSAFQPAGSSSWIPGNPGS